MMAMDVNLLVYHTPTPVPSPFHVRTQPRRGSRKSILRFLRGDRILLVAWAHVQPLLAFGLRRWETRTFADVLRRTWTCERGTETRTKEVLDLRRHKEES